MKNFAGLLAVGLLAIQVVAQPTNIPLVVPPPTSVADGFLEVYAQLTGKTVLRPCTFPKLAGASYAQLSTNKLETTNIIEKEFNKTGHEFVPAGEKFVMVLQSAARTNARFAAQLSRFQPPAKGTNSADIPDGSAHFQNVPIDNFLDFYARLRGCKIAQPIGLPAVCITFQNQQKLTREEFIYALNVTMVLNGVVPVEQADKTVALFTVSQAPPPR